MDEKEYQTFTTFEGRVEKEERSSHPLPTISNPNTPCTPAPCTPAPCTPMTPSTPSTPASVSVTDETDHSQFSLSIDSGIESPQEYLLPGTPFHTFINGRNMKPPRLRVSPASKAADHTNKEKLRRERIKDSCDQLRVLLPYIRGRKTDMASVLEMCVEYLRIVNAFMPQTLQEQIVDILSKETPPIFNPKGKENKVGVQHVVPKSEVTITSSSSLQTSPFLTDKNADFTLPSPGDINHNDLQSNSNEDKGSKRQRLIENNGTVTHFEEKLDHIVTCHSDVTPTCNFHSNQVGNLQLEEQNYSRLYGDGYSTAQQIFNNYTNNKNLQIEPADYIRSTYLDTYHFYPGMINNGVPQTRVFSGTPDYVNPNAVLQTLPYTGVIVKSANGLEKMEGFTSMGAAEQQKEDKTLKTP